MVWSEMEIAGVIEGISVETLAGYTTPGLAR